MEILWNQTSRTNWARLTGSGGALQQDWAYGAACTALGSDVLRAEIRDAGVAIGAVQLIHRPFLGLVHAAVATRGPVWRPGLARDAMAEALRCLCRALPLPRWRGLFVTPETDASDSLGESGFHRIMTPYATVELDLTRPAEALRTAMHQKWRNRLVGAERAGLEIGRADARPEMYRWLLEAETGQQRRLRYRALPPELVPMWQQAGGGLRIYTAERDERMLGAMLFLLHGNRATYHIGWIHPEGRRISAHNLLLWHAMQKLPKMGVDVLDLGGINTRESPGVARFKLGTGGQVRTLCGTWVHI